MVGFLCDTKRTKCPDVWEHITLGESKCKHKTRKLPTVDKQTVKAEKSKAKAKKVFDNGLINGWKATSLACHVLHAQFVVEGNFNHDPHISFKPMKAVSN